MLGEADDKPINADSTSNWQIEREGEEEEEEGGAGMGDRGIEDDKTQLSA